MQPTIEVGALPASNRYDPSEKYAPATLVELVLGNSEFENDLDDHGIQASCVAVAATTVVHVPRPVDMAIGNVSGEHSIEYSDHDSELSIGTSNLSHVQSGPFGSSLVPSNSIVSITSFKIPSIGGIHSFKLTMADGTEISTFDPDFWPVELAIQGRSATEHDHWRLAAGSTTSNFYNFMNEDSSFWLFLTDSGQLGHLFDGSTSPRQSNMRLQRFLVAGGNLQVSIDQKAGNLCLGPITAMSSDASVAPTIKRVDMFFTDQGVIGFHFVEHAQGAPCLVSTGSLCSSFELQDFGSPDAECITELCALQDDTRLHALQVITNRGRASTLKLPDLWLKSSLPTFPSAQQVCNELRPKLEEKLDEQFTGARIMKWLGFSRSEWYCVYPSGILVFVLMTFLCTALAGLKSDSILTAVLIIMFVLACSCLCGGCYSISSRKYYLGHSYVRSRNVCIFSLVWFIALVVGVTASSAWLTPWWFATRGGKVYDVDATAASWIANRTSPDYGIYYFSQSISSGTAAFINQAKAGAFYGQQSWYCVAPIVTSWNQTKVLFWAADTGCCSKSEVTCWHKFNSPGSAAISASVKAPLRYFDEFEAARNASCTNLAVNTSSSAKALCSLPVVYLDVASSTTAEDTVNYNLLCGLLFTCLIAIVWPFPVYLLANIWADCDCKSGCEHQVPNPYYRGWYRYPGWGYYGREGVGF